jgi:hypothetical protein
VAFGKLTLESMAEVAFHGGRADAFPLAEAPTTDAIQVLAEDRQAKRFAGMLAGKNPGQALAELAAAALTLPLAGRDCQPAMAQSEVFVAYETGKPALAAQLLALTMRAGLGPGIPGPNPYLSTLPLNLGNLVIGQT